MSDRAWDGRGWRGPAISVALRSSSVLKNLLDRGGTSPAVIARFGRATGSPDDRFRPRKGFGAENMAVVRHCAVNLVRAAKDKNSVKLRRKVAGRDRGYLDGILNERIS